MTIPGYIRVSKTLKTLKKLEKPWIHKDLEKTLKIVK